MGGGNAAAPLCPTTGRHSHTRSKMCACTSACAGTTATGFVPSLFHSRMGSMLKSAAEIVREYGPFPGVDQVHGVTFDGRHVWFASGDKLNAFDPANGTMVRSIDVAGHAGTAFDGQHLFQLAEDRIQKIDPKTGRVLATIPAPGGGGDSGLTWA